MEAIEPAYGATTLLLIAAGAVAALLFLIMKVRLHAFVALVLVSAATALVVGFPLSDIPDVLMSGFSSTLGSVALLVAFGVMLGRLLEITGGAQVLSDTLIARFGEQRAPLALGVASMVFGFPIFFDAGLVVFLPIILTVARRFGGNLLYYALPAAGGFAIMHAIVPPHPGPVAASEALGANIGITMLLGIPIAVASWYLGAMLLTRFLGVRLPVAIPEAVFGEINGGRQLPSTDEPEAGGQSTKDPAPGDAAQAEGTGEAANGAGVLGGKLPAFSTVLALLLLPLVLISFNTGLDTLVKAGALDEGQSWVDFLRLLGNTPIALLTTVLVAVWVLGRPRTSMANINDIVDQALGPVCSIILITGAGGMFGGVLKLSGIGAALSDSLADLGMSLIFQAFVIAMLLRVAQGSATVAITTTAGLMAGSVQQAGLGDVQLTLLVVAIAAGGSVLSHFNDSGFWLVSRLFQMDEKTTLKTWTVLETTLGLSAFAIALGLWAVV